MFKLLILSAVFVAVKAGGYYSAPLSPITYDATIAAPATTSTYAHSSSYIAPTYTETTYYPHFIKKRSPQYYAYIEPNFDDDNNFNRAARLIQSANVPLYSSFLAPSLYNAGAQVAAAYISPAPIPLSSVLPIQPAHLIKKRASDSSLEHDVEKRSASLPTPISSTVYPSYLGSGYFPSAPITFPYTPPTLCSSYSSHYPGYPTLPYIKK